MQYPSPAHRWTGLPAVDHADFPEATEDHPTHTSLSLTASGRGVLVVAVVSLVAGWLLGMTESFVLAGAAVSALFVSLSRSLLVRPRLSVHRRVAPHRSTVGGTYELTLEVHNTARRRSAPVVMTEMVLDSPLTTVAIGPLAPSAGTTVSASIPTNRRGVMQVGPARHVLVDPFGLVERQTVTCPTEELLVLPHLWPVTVPSDASRGRGGSSGPAGRTHDSDAEEFSTLGEFVPGDDRRHIHWPSTARVGHLMVRRFEPYEPRRAHVVLERYADNPVAFEVAVSICAGVVTALHAQGEVVSFGVADVDRTSDGTDDPTTHIRSGSDLGAVMDRLAVVEPQLRIPVDVDGAGHRRLNHRVSSIVASVPPQERSVIERLVVIGPPPPAEADQDPVRALGGGFGTAPAIRWIHVPPGASTASMDRDRIQEIVDGSGGRSSGPDTALPTPSSFRSPDGVTR